MSFAKICKFYCNHSIFLIETPGFTILKCNELTNFDYMAVFFLTGFYDTSEEVYVAEEPNFKRLRQQNLEGERRTDKEEVNKIYV